MFLTLYLNNSVWFILDPWNVFCDNWSVKTG